MKNAVKVLIASLFIFLFFQNADISGANFKPMSNDDEIIHLPKDWKEGKSKCPLHKEILKKDKIHITYGEVDVIPDYYKARGKKFPFANISYLGGCVVQKEKFAVVAYCDKCRKAEKMWIASNK